MAIKSGLFNSVNGDRRYKADFFAEYFASFIANGVFPNPSTGLQVIANGGMSVSIRAGKAWINGYYMSNDSDYNMQLEVADGVLKRIDRIVLRLDFLSRQIIPTIKKGVFASSPTAPPLQRDADAYELGLATILINNGAISISQANITDTRLNTAVCGIVHGTVNQVDTSTIFNQYLAWFNDITSGVESEINEWQAVQKGEFDAWFASIQDILDGDVAANLAARISNLEQTVATHLADEIKHITAAERTSWNAKETPSGALTKVEQNSFKTVKTNKDANGIYTTVEHRRKSDDKLVRRSVLSGGTSPQYTTRTVTYYAADGITVSKTETFTLTYDADGDLISEV